MKLIASLLGLALAVSALVGGRALAQSTTAFTYQGRLTESNAPAMGSYDFRFTIHRAADGGNPLAEPLLAPSVVVSNGLFTVQLDFGANVFNGEARWLEIGVHTNDSFSPFVTLSPRQPITALPYALHARNVASNAIVASSIQDGVITDGKIADDQVVKSLNGLRDHLTLLPGNNITFELLGNTLEIASTGWGLFGNAGTDVATHFLGTTDNRPLLFKVNNTRVMRLELNGLSPNVIGGFALNNAAPGVSGATISGGGGYISAANSVHADYATVSGGSGNSAGGFASFIGGGENNNIGSNANHAVISGGVRNLVEPNARGAAIIGGENNSIRKGAQDTAIVGGFGNSAGMNALANIIGSGQGNNISSNVQASTISGGFQNSVSAGATYVAIGGGQGNTIENLFDGVIGGGAANTIARGADYATIGGGLNNRIETNSGRATIAGGDNNDIEFGAPRSTIGGGWNNIIESGSAQSGIGGGAFNRVRYDTVSGTISGGRDNTIHPFANYASIGGGLQNSVSAGSATISGGFENEIQNAAAQATISGGWNNAIQSNAQGATISGGTSNIVQTNSPRATIGGGSNNMIEGDATGATIGGGQGNTVGTNAASATITGGEMNMIEHRAKSATIGGGISNNIVADSAGSAIAGGMLNTIGTNSDHSSIGGGAHNVVATNSPFATIPGGRRNFAALLAFAAGCRARAIHEGAFVWADAFDIDFESMRDNQFCVRAHGGAYFDIGGDDVGYYEQWIDLRYQYVGETPAIINTSSGAFLSWGGAWIDESDRNRKENFEPVCPTEILEKVVHLPVSKWNYKVEGRSVRHIGTMAQDFHTAFGVGGDDKHIAALDGNGVALAAIQGLNQKLSEELKRRDAENAALKEAVGELKAMVEALSEKLAESAR